MAKVLLGLACAGAGLAGVYPVGRRMRASATACWRRGVALRRAVALLLGDLLVMPELWSGVFVALSAVCLALDRRGWGVACGVARCSFASWRRPILVCLALAAANVARASWPGGCWAWRPTACFMPYHLAARAAANLGRRRGPRRRLDSFRRGGLLDFHRADERLSAARAAMGHGHLPGLALVGATAWNTPAGRRSGCTVAVYAMAFSMVGHDFNQYWGSMIAPLLCLGVCPSRCAVPACRRWRPSRVGDLFDVAAQSLAGNSLGVGATASTISASASDSCSSRSYTGRVAAGRHSRAKVSLRRDARDVDRSARRGTAAVRAPGRRSAPRIRRAC